MLASFRAGFADSTKKNLAIQKAKYVAFCNKYARRSFPASLDTLCLYAQHLAQSFKSVDAISNYIMGIRTLHALKGFSTTHFDHKVLSILLRGLRRIKAHITKQALPITPALLLDIHKLLRQDNLEDRVFWALCLMAFFSAFRKSNLVPNSIGCFNPHKQLLRRDVIFDQSGMWVRKRWSKTIQFGQRHLVVPILKVPQSPLCPLTAYKLMCQAMPAGRGAPAFVIAQGGRLVPYTYRQWLAKLKDTIAKTGRNPDRFSTHSFRKGGGFLCS